MPENQEHVPTSEERLAVLIQKRDQLMAESTAKLAQIEAEAAELEAQEAAAAEGAKTEGLLSEREAALGSSKENSAEINNIESEGEKLQAEYTEANEQLEQGEQELIKAKADLEQFEEVQNAIKKMEDVPDDPYFTEKMNEASQKVEAANESIKVLEAKVGELNEKLKVSEAGRAEADARIEEITPGRVEDIKTPEQRAAVDALHEEALETNEIRNQSGMEGSLEESQNFLQYEEKSELEGKEALEAFMQERYPDKQSGSEQYKEKWNSIAIGVDFLIFKDTPYFKKHGELSYAEYSSKSDYYEGLSEFAERVESAKLESPIPTEKTPTDPNLNEKDIMNTVSDLRDELSRSNLDVGTSVYLLAQLMRMGLSKPEVQYQLNRYGLLNQLDQQTIADSYVAAAQAETENTTVRNIEAKDLAELVKAGLVTHNFVLDRAQKYVERYKNRGVNSGRNPYDDHVRDRNLSAAIRTAYEFQSEGLISQEEMEQILAY